MLIVFRYMRQLVHLLKRDSRSRSRASRHATYRMKAVKNDYQDTNHRIVLPPGHDVI